LWDLKALAAHGEFMNKLKERFPKVSYAKCNRWMNIAENETRVAAAIEKYPNVAWGPKTMIDYLKGSWTPEEDAEHDEDDEELINDEPLHLLEPGDAEVSTKIAKMADVSPSTMKKVNAVKENAPDNLNKKSKGETKDTQEDTPAEPENDTPAKPLTNAEPGNKVFTLQPYELGNGDIALLEHILLKVESGSCHFEDGGTMDASAIYDKANATLRRQAKLKTELESLLMEVSSLRKAAKNPPAIQPAQKRRKDSQ
jgi:hypothetical protein